MTNTTFDFIVVGAGSAGCAVTVGLIEAKQGTVCTLDAGCSDNSPLVKTPFALMFMMGSRKRDWRYTTTLQTGLGGRVLAVPRGKMTGGSGSINSMVWFRGRMDDFDNCGVDGWSSAEVIPLSNKSKHSAENYVMTDRQVFIHSGFSSRLADQGQLLKQPHANLRSACQL